MKREIPVRNDLGHYGSMEEVWRNFPAGGHPGEYVWIGSALYVWDAAQRNWRSDVYPDRYSYNAMHMDGDFDIGNDLSVGGDATIMQNATVKKDLRIEGTLLYGHLQGMDCGLFPDVYGLQYAYPSPTLGQWALVGTDTDDLELYMCKNTGQWYKAGYAKLKEVFDLKAYDAAKAIVDDLAERGYVFMGCANPGTKPVRPKTHNVFYLSTTPGRYDYFGGARVQGLSVLQWDHNADPDQNGESLGQWKATSLLSGVFVYKENIAVGAVTLEVAPAIAQRILQVENEAVHAREEMDLDEAYTPTDDDNSARPSGDVEPQPRDGGNLVTDSSEIL